MDELAIRHRFTVDELHRMGEAGILSEDDRVELVNGEIVEMTPIGSAHAGCVRDLDEWLQEWLRGEAMVSTQQPMIVELDGEAIPDVAGAYGRGETWRSPALRDREVSVDFVLDGPGNE